MGTSSLFAKWFKFPISVVGIQCILLSDTGHSNDTSPLSSFSNKHSIAKCAHMRCIP